MCPSKFLTCCREKHSTSKVSFFSFFTDFGVPRIAEMDFSMIKGESFVTGLEESADSITRKRANVVEGIEYSDSESESESTRLAFF